MMLRSIFNISEKEVREILLKKYKTLNSDVVFKAMDIFELAWNNSFGKKETAIPCTREADFLSKRMTKSIRSLRTECTGVNPADIAEDVIWNGIVKLLPYEFKYGRRTEEEASYYMVLSLK